MVILGGMTGMWWNQDWNPGLLTGISSHTCTVSTLSDLDVTALELGTARAHLITICRDRSVVCQQLCPLSFSWALLDFPASLLAILSYQELR